MWSDGSASPKSVLDNGAKPASHKLVVRPRFDYQHGSHGCPLCPANLCKVGKQVRGLTRWKVGVHPLSGTLISAEVSVLGWQPIVCNCGIVLLLSLSTAATNDL